MKKKINYQIFINFLIYMVISIFIFTTINYSTIKSSLSEKEEIEVESKAIVYETQLRNQIEDLNESILYLGKDLTYENERPIYLIQNFKEKTEGIHSIYLYNSAREITGKYSDNNKYEEFIGKQLKDIFFYEPILWEEIENGLYFIYFKITYKDEKYLSVVLNLNELLSEFENNRTEDIILVNTFGMVISKTLNASSQNINQMSIKNEILNGHTKTDYFNSEFISFRPLLIDEVDLFILLKKSDQGYKGDLRIYLVKAYGIGIFLLVLGFLIAWRLIRVIYDYFVLIILSEKYQETEFKKIHDEIIRAIEWIEDVVLHYDELNELKEELIELNGRLPKESERYDKKRLLKKLKGK